MKAVPARPKPNTERTGKAGKYKMTWLDRAFIFLVAILMASLIAYSISEFAHISKNRKACREAGWHDYRAGYCIRDESQTWGALEDFE